MLPAEAFIGASICTYLVYAVSLHEGRLSVTTMLLAGIAFNAIGVSALGMLQYIADDDELRRLTFWMMGRLGGATWEKVQMIRVVACITLTGSFLISASSKLLITRQCRSCAPWRISTACYANCSIFGCFGSGLYHRNERHDWISGSRGATPNSIGCFARSSHCDCWFRATWGVSTRHS